ncbi:hypothetical protein PYCC9005_003163 [Savitreella phatthalungensis]
MPRLVRADSRSVLGVFADWALAQYEIWSTLDFDELSQRWYTTGAFVLNGSYWLASYQLQFAQERYNGNIFSRPGPDEAPLTSIAVIRLLWSFTAVLAIVSTANLIYCFNCTKVYRSNDVAGRRNTGWLAQGMSMAGRFTTYLLAKTAAKEENDEHNRTTALEIWNPSLTSLRLLAIFSPVHAYLGWHFARQPPVLLGLFFLTSLLLLIVDKYDTLVRDKQLVYTQVFRDYDRNFVGPRLSVVKRDVGVGTRADDNGVYVEVHTPKTGIISNSQAVGNKLPRSTSLVRMYDWQDQNKGTSTPSQLQLHSQSQHLQQNSSQLPPLLHKGANPAKRSQSMASLNTGGMRRTVASPFKQADGSPAKIFRAAGWGSSTSTTHVANSSSSAAAQFLRKARDPEESTPLRRSRTFHEL